MAKKGGGGGAGNTHHAYRKVGVLNAAKRNKLAPSQFAGPHKSYPVPDANHARNALARVSQAVKAGRMSASQAAKIRAKARRVLARTKS